MNTSQLKKFAQGARVKLLEQVAAKLEYVLTSDTAELREKAKELKALREELDRIGKEQLVEKVAYTWFNRLMALRFMDANDYQPSGIRIVSPKDDYTLPQILDEAKQGHFAEEITVDSKQVLDILDGRIPSDKPQNEAYRILLIAACNALSKQFPFLFEVISDYSELLLPDDLTSEFSVVHDIRMGMTIEDCQEVEIIGWIYQFYISEKKDEVFASKAKVKKEDIPAATQLFTPRWIVEYLVQNTLGKLWLQNRPLSQLRDHMPYYIESASLTADEYLVVGSPVEIKLLDQACGSGHILIYAFELLTKIYEEEGYTPSDIPRLIIEKNLYGFEIDGRAAQLANLALLMKARSYYRRLFRKDIQPNILCFQDVSFESNELENYLDQMKLDIFNHDLQADIELFENATNYGSLIKLKTQELPIVEQSLPPTNIFLAKTHQKVQSVLYQMNLLNQKYHCVVDNPPYMGGGKMNKTLGDWVKINYSKSKADMMVCFMERAQEQVYENGFVGMINLPSWMFLSSFEAYRKEINSEYKIDSLLHLGRGIFGSDFGSVAFTFIKRKGIKSKGVYRRLFKKHVQVRSVEKIRNLFLDKSYGHYTANQKDFEKIPGSPIGYWLSEDLVKLFDSPVTINDVGNVLQGMIPGNTDVYIRIWSEVENLKTGFGISKDTLISKLNYKWFLYNKGGAFRKWYGNIEHVLNMENNGQSIKNDGYNNNYRLRDPNVYFKPALTWSKISSGSFSMRKMDEGHLFDIAGCCVFNLDDFDSVLAFLNSKVCAALLQVISPTLNYEVAHIKSLPNKLLDNSSLEQLSISCQDICKLEWNSRESSWDFKKNELLKQKGQDLEESYDLYLQYWTNKFQRLHKNEEEINHLFIENYDLQEELTPDVPLKEIAILKEETSIDNGELVFNAKEVFAQFLSYSVGCMFGRYSLDKEGLILANQGDTLGEYAKIVDKELNDLSFVPDDDAIIPILDDEWFEDDIVGRFHEFLKVTFGEKEFSKNLAFVEEQIGVDIRKYFVKEFYNDHVKRYKKRPIYWLFSSPKGSFRVLVYMHRYSPDTINNILNNYLREFIQKLKSQKQHYEQVQVSGSTSEQNQAMKQIDKLDAMILDCEDYEREILYPLAIERIAIDLDDGVLVNYNKFGIAIKEVKGLNDKKAKEKVRKFDWIDTTLIR